MDEESDLAEFYEVEKILNHRVDMKRGEIQFQVKWRGYKESAATWETF